MLFGGQAADALRRDLVQVAQSDERTAGWSTFEQMLHEHHSIEDDLLWPVEWTEVPAVVTSSGR